ncbi:hypothetical protein M8J75_013233 [Diaphorina citri]|nr:hypothetical protein M8J75_013233 [Diaphorina citri]KAI5753370.1 hypothetical protein M8J77_026286 [Diaphorina citri]
MEGMVEENGGGTSDPLAPSSPDIKHNIAVTSVASVIQANQQSVIQTATGNLSSSAVLTKGNVILVSKPNSVIQTTQGQLQTLQVVDGASDDSLSAEDNDVKRSKRRDITLTRRPSYRKILNDLRGAEIATGKVESSGSDCDDSNLDSELSSHSLPTHYQTVSVIPAGHIHLSSQGGDHQTLPTITMTNASSAGGTIVQYSQDGQFFVPSEIVVTQNSPNLSTSPILGTGEDQSRKREMRLLKNREAAKECRRKKKEYIKCLENRVAILENQNKALIDELKSLKELYCQQEME